MTRRWKHQELFGNVELQLHRGMLCTDRFRGQAGGWGEEEISGRAAGSKGSFLGTLPENFLAVVGDRGCWDRAVGGLKW